VAGTSVRAALLNNASRSAVAAPSMLQGEDQVITLGTAEKSGSLDSQQEPSGGGYECDHSIRRSRRDFTPTALLNSVHLINRD
jgi:hypothetical protein